LELAARCRVLKVGDITVAIDGTKVLANASRHSAVSYGRAGEQLRQVEWEIEQLLAKAEADDAQPLQDGLNLEGELARRQERKARLQQARAEIEARAFARAQQERARKTPDQPGPPAPPTPAATDQYNYTDPPSKKPGNYSALPGSAKMAQPFYSSSAEDEVRHAARAEPEAATRPAARVTM